MTSLLYYLLFFLSSDGYYYVHGLPSMADGGILSMSAALEGFTSEIVLSQTKAITGTVVQNPKDLSPMMLLASKKGKISVLENPDEYGTSYTTTKEGKDPSEVILDLSEVICSNGERGIQSVVAHPDFGYDNLWIYLFYNQNNKGDCFESKNNGGPRNILSRFTMNNDTLMLENEEILLVGAPLKTASRNGGALLFGTEGYLYVSIGDDGEEEGVTNHRNFQGSLLRLNDDGDGVPDNPFAERGVACGKSNGVVPSNHPNDVYCSEIYSWGFRNPFRLALDQTYNTNGDVEDNSNFTTTFAITDVGQNQYEEISWGGSEFKGKNYGWPKFEGPSEYKMKDSFPIPVEDSGVVDPFYYYAHESKNNGGCIAGVTFVPAGIWPSNYKILFVDFVLLKIYNLIEDADKECRSCLPPVPGYRNTTLYESIHNEDDHINEARMIDLFFAPYKDTQALYVIKYGNRNSVIRIRYTGNLNAPPIATIKLKHSDIDDDDYVYDEGTFQVPTNTIKEGQIVVFDGSGSKDPDGDELTYEWDFGDGNNSTSQNPSHIYNKSGEYQVSLLVTDMKYEAHQSSITVVVGRPPIAIILSPMEGELFSAGKQIRLLGEAYDEGGTLLKNSQLSWEVNQVYADHYHSFLDPTNGNDLTLFPAPEPEDFFASTNSYLLEVIMYATDAKNLTTASSRYIKPDIVNIDIFTEPEGLEITIDKIGIQTPTQVTFLAGSNLPFQTYDQPPYVFVTWSDGYASSSRKVGTLSDGDDNQGGKRNVTAIFCLDYAAICDEDNNITASCCSGYCNEDGLCGGKSMTEGPETNAVPSSTHSIINSVDINSDDNDIEPGNKKPIFPDFHNDEAIDLVTNEKIDSVQNDNNDSDDLVIGLKVYGKWLLGMAVFLLCLAPCYLGYKYRQLYRKMEAGSKRASSDTLHPSIHSPICTSFDKEDDTLNGTDSNESVLKSHYNFDGPIWGKIADEKDRRIKLRAKLSSANDHHQNASGTTIVLPPGTPDTFESSTSTEMLTASIDENLVRLEGLLSNTFSKRMSRSNKRSQDDSNHSDSNINTKTKSTPEDYTETRLIENDLESSADQSDLAPLWGVSNQGINRSPIREKNSSDTVN